ncbi:MAG: ABC transporter ATP-binding protein [Halobacteriaceae archaeon]
MADVELEHLTKRYGDVVAVDDVSLKIHDDEFVTLVGPSGCGKTTTLRTIAGFEEPTEGTIKIGGKDVTHLKPYQRDVGMVFQSFALFPHLSVFDNIAYGLRESTDMDEDDIEAKVTELLELIQLPDIGDRDPQELSGGQQQRVALARALALEPEVLLLDEPLASLDKKLREQMQVELRRLHEQLQFTTIFVTHNQREAMSMSDRIFVMNEGKFVQTGSPESVYRDPSSQFVADFIGSSNLLEGTLTAYEDNMATIELGDWLTLQTQTSVQRDVGSTVTLSVRPENIELIDAEPSETNEFVGEIGVIRYLGGTLECHLEKNGTSIVAEVDPASVGDIRDRDTITVRIPTDAPKLLQD